MLSLSFALALAQGQRFRRGTADASAVPVQMVVTAEPSKGRKLPPLSHADVVLVLDEANRPVTECVALQDDSAGLELYILIDEKVNPAAAARFDELRRFVSSQTPATAVGIAYMHNGEAEIVMTPTKDLARAAKALRLPSGNTSSQANPFNSLSALINGWSTGAARREVVAVTDGVDSFGDIGAASTYLECSIQDAQRAGVQVFSIYARGSGDAGDSRELIRGGQAYLAQLAEETGGAAFFKEGESSTSFNPYLANIARRLAHQYRITFLVTPVAGQSFHRVGFTTKLEGVEVISPRGFYLGTDDPRP